MAAAMQNKLEVNQEMLPLCVRVFFVFFLWLLFFNLKICVVDPGHGPNKPEHMF